MDLVFRRNGQRRAGRQLFEFAAFAEHKPRVRQDSETSPFYIIYLFMLPTVSICSNDIAYRPNCGLDKSRYMPPFVLDYIIISLKPLCE